MVICNRAGILCVLLLSASHALTEVPTFTEPGSLLNHLVVDSNTGHIYIGTVNRIYQLSADLEVTQSIVTGPAKESINCTDCSVKSTDNVNKVLLIDYASNRLITCGSALQSCSVRDLNNLNRVLREVQEPVVRSAQASTVAFIAPGPPNPAASRVMYVGATGSYTPNLDESIVPAVSSRSLEDDSLFMIAQTEFVAGTRIFVNSLSRERYPINYVYGFSSEGFSYFLTTQSRNVGSDSYYSKLVRVCHDDPNYYSYTEIPITCMGGGNNYNLVQAAFVGKAGSVLVKDLEINAQNDVLFATFSPSESKNTSTPSDVSAICVYSLKDIRRKFTQNIQSCFRGEGSRGLDFISPSYSCIRTQLQVNEDFCGLDINTPLGGEQPVEAVSAAMFTKRLTAVLATVTGDNTVVFAGTADGHLKKIVVESATSAFEYSDIVVDQSSPVNKDLFFDTQQRYLYVMTDHKISKVNIGDCSVYESCLTCVEVNDPYCGWCSSEHKCSIQSDCKDSAEDPVYWRQRVPPYRNTACAAITQVTPQRLQRTTTTTLNLHGTIRMHFDNGTPIRDKEKFEYVEDPVVMSVESGPSSYQKQPKGTPSGGTKIKVLGRNFHGIQSSHINVYYNNRSFVAPCNKVDGDTELLCESPRVECDVLLDAEAPLELEYGFHMNGVESVRNLRSQIGAFLLYPDPVYEKFDGGIKHHKADYLTINGLNLDRACTPDEVEVRIGNTLANVTSLSRQQLTCRLPFPNELSSGEDALKVEVKVWGRLTFNIGKLYYTLKH